MLSLNDFHYNLPKELIAQVPLEERSSSRLLTLNKKTGDISHMHFFNIVDLLNSGDCLVINDTKVMPARLIGEREKTGAKIELLLLNRKGNDIWEVLANPAKRVKQGEMIVFGDGALKAEIIDALIDGNRIIKFHYDGIFEEILNELGQMPLPPYITEKLQDKERYQTVYASEEGSAAAPTAGLHMTNEILSSLENKGVVISKITLHVGLGTFRPVKTSDITKHEMHSEYYNITESEAKKINTAKTSGGRIVAVGTTSIRTLESISNSEGFINYGCGYTDIFIYPPYKFKTVDALITNFHLPESTLIMLVSALAGHKNTMNAYDEAVRQKYRFFSFGDAMFIY